MIITVEEVRRQMEAAIAELMSGRYRTYAQKQAALLGQVKSPHAEKSAGEGRSLLAVRLER